MGFIDFIANNTLTIGFVIILLFLIWRFGIQPRLGLTDREIEKKVTDMMDEVQENLSSNMQVESEDLFDKGSMPFSD